MPEGNERQYLDQINDDDLSTYILNRLRDDIRDRESFGWTAMRQYDILSYDGIKSKAKEPWYNAANFPTPLTPTLLDTGHSHTIQSIWSNPRNVVKVEGIGQEDERNAKNLSILMNWQVVNHIEDSYQIVDKTVQRAYKHGNGIIKVVHGDGVNKDFKVNWSMVPVENFYLPVNATGIQPNKTDHIIELISLDDVEWEQRKALRNPDGTPFYNGIEELAKGNAIGISTARDAITATNDIASGTSLGQKYSRDMRYMIECYLTYIFKPEGSDIGLPLELIVWMAPMGGKIFKKVINPDFDPDTGRYVRPYSAEWKPYPRDDRWYGDSLPWIIKPIQEELDYAQNQNLNAAELAIKPPKFYRQGCGFDPEAYEAVPDGWYPTATPSQDIFIPTFNVNPIFERQLDKYWDLAERRTGFTELFQGRSPDIRQTATLTVARENKSEVRFNTIYRRFAQGWNELMQLTYFYDKKYMPDDVKIKSIGYANYKSLRQLFPNGIQGKYNFYFASETTVEQERKRQDIAEFYGVASANPIVANDPVNQWRLLNMFAESRGIRDLDTVIQKPPEVEILSPDESLRRILGGDLDIVPDPNINAPYYITKIAMFMRTEMFLEAEPEVQQAVQVLLQRVQAINYGQQQAINDAQILQAYAQAEAQQQASMQSQMMEGSGAA